MRNENKCILGFKIAGTYHISNSTPKVQKLSSSSVYVNTYEKEVGQNESNSPVSSSLS